MSEQQFDDGLEVGHFGKNATERVYARLTSYKGYELCDLRVHYDAGTTYKPTGKGFSIKRELIPDLIKLLREAEALCTLEHD
jgi:hypothetical protein